jgi:putative transposase
MDQTTRQETLKAVLHYFFQETTRAGSHCRYSLQYHLVWIPKYRRSFLVGAIAERLLQILREIARDYRFFIIAMEVMPDHIHMLIEAPPKYAPSRIVQIFKSISARRLRQEFPQRIQRYIWKEHVVWAVGYYIGSVGNGATTELVREYIENQKANDKTLPQASSCTQMSLFE